MEINSIQEGILAIAEKEGVSHINKFEGCWEHKIDDNWTIKTNGHDKEIEDVPPFHTMIFYNGHIAGLVSPFGGTIARGRGANETNLIKAMVEYLKTN